MFDALARVEAITKVPSQWKCCGERKRGSGSKGVEEKRERARSGVSLALTRLFHWELDSGARQATNEFSVARSSTFVPKMVKEMEPSDSQRRPNESVSNEKRGVLLKSVERLKSNDARAKTGINLVKREV